MRQTPVSDNPQQEGSRDERKAELERLFKEWESRAPGTPIGGLGEDDDAVFEGLGRTSRSDRLLWRSVFLAIIVALTAFFMWNTRHEFAYFIGGGDAPTDLGDLQERFKNGERALEAESNSWVKMSGMFMTMELEVVAKDESGVEELPENEEGTRKYFLCPLFDVVVRTTQRLPDKPWKTNSIEIDPAFTELINLRKAFPVDLTATFSGQGRLVRVSEAPGWARSAVQTYARRATRLDPKHAWVFIDGDSPSDYGEYLVLWIVALLAPLVSLILWLRAFQAHRRAARA